MLARHYFLPSSTSPSTTSPSTTSPQPPTNSTTTTATDTTTPPTAAEYATPPDGAFNIAIQDGAEAGQTVSHVHVHVIPRIRGATAKPASTPSDAVYDQMAAEEGNVGGALWDRDRDRARRLVDQRGGGVEGEGERVMVGGVVVDGEGRPLPGGSFPSIEDAGRVERGMGEMEAEAAVYRGVLERMERDGL